MSQAKNPESHGGRKPNRLINEQSPYLRQHAYNPVDWYAWGDEALARAKAENKPILLSIGYSACHWCHVMERESFENDAIARLMNENFIPIKVDREERPDLDQIYMDAVQLITGRGGWPLTMFLTPDGRPFFGGTYYPPEDRQGMPGFPRVLAAVSQAYRDKAQEVTNNVEKLTEALGALTNYVPTGGDLKPGLAAESARALARTTTVSTAAWGRRRNFPTRSCSRCFFACMRPTATSRWPRWFVTRCRRWRAAESTIRSAAGSIATASTSDGWCRTSRRCSTTTRCWRGFTSTPAAR